MIKNEYKVQAKVLLAGHWSKSIVITLLSFIYIFLSILLIDIVASLFYNRIVTGILLFLDVFIILPVLYSATISIKNINTKEDKFHYSNFINIAIANVKRVFKVGGLLFLETLPSLLILILSFALLIWTVFQVTYIYVLSGTITSNLIIIIVISFLLTVIFSNILIKKWILHLISSYIMDEEKDLKMMEVITKSKLVFKNNKKKFMQLNSSFSLWNLLAVLTLGIGYIFLLPFIKLSYYLAYKSIDK